MVSAVLEDLEQAESGEVPVDGGTTLYEPVGPVSSKEIAALRFSYVQNDVFGGHEPEREFCPPGEYRIRLEPAEGALPGDGSTEELAEGAQPGDMLLCSLNYNDRLTEFAADRSVLPRLQQVLESSGIAEQNGYSARNSALGDYLDLEVDYASGEELTLYGEGGDVLPPCDLAALIVFFNGIAEENGEHFTRRMPVDMAEAAFIRFAEETAGVSAAQYDADTETDEERGTAWISVFGMNEDGEDVLTACCTAELPLGLATGIVCGTIEDGEVTEIEVPDEVSLWDLAGPAEAGGTAGAAGKTGS